MFGDGKWSTGVEQMVKSEILEGIRLQWEAIRLIREGLKIQDQGLAQVEAIVASTSIEYCFLY